MPAPVTGRIESGAPAVGGSPVGAGKNSPRGIADAVDGMSFAASRDDEGAASSAPGAAAAAMGNTQAPGGEDRSVELCVQETEEMKLLRTEIVNQERLVANQQALVEKTHQLFLTGMAQERKRVDFDEAGNPKWDAQAHSVIDPFFNIYSANQKNLNVINWVLLQNKHRLAFVEAAAYLTAARAKFPSGAFPPNIKKALNRLQTLNQKAQKAVRKEKARQQAVSGGAGPATPPSAQDKGEKTRAAVAPPAPQGLPATEEKPNTVFARLGKAIVAGLQILTTAWERFSSWVSGLFSTKG